MPLIIIIPLIHVGFKLVQTLITRDQVGVRDLSIYHQNSVKLFECEEAEQARVVSNSF